MTYGFDLLKRNGSSAYRSGDSSLRFLGIIEYDIGNFSYTPSPPKALDRLNEYDVRGLVDLYNGRPKFVEAFGPGQPKHFGGNYDDSRVVMFWKGPPSIRINIARVHVRGSARLGFFIAGSAPAGSKLRLYCFSPGRPTNAEANRGHGISVFDESGVPLYTSGFSDLILQGVLTITGSSAFRPDPFQFGLRRSRAVSANFINSNSAVNVVGGGISSGFGYTSRYSEFEGELDYSTFGIRPGAIDIYKCKHIVSMPPPTSYHYYAYVPQKIDSYFVMSIDAHDYDRLNPSVVKRSLAFVDPIYE